MAYIPIVSPRLKFLICLVVAVGLSMVVSTVLFRIRPVQRLSSGLMGKLYPRMAKAPRPAPPVGSQVFALDDTTENTAFNRVAEEGRPKKESSPKLASLSSSPSPSSSPSFSASMISNSLFSTTGWSSAITTAEQEVYPSTTEDPIRWKQKIKKRFEERKEFLTRQCDSFEGNYPKRVEESPMTFYYYTPKYDILACISAKGGASTWKSHFLYMNGYDKTFTHPHSAKAQKDIRSKYLLSSSKLMKKLSNADAAIQVISVRHPFARLVSAYTDKYSGGRQLKPTRMRKMYFAKPLKMMGLPFPPPHKASVPFSVFLRYVLYQWDRKKMDRHWRPYTSNCRPCHVPWNYIVNLETINEDIRYLVLEHNITEIDVDLQKNPSSHKSKTTYLDYFQGVSDDVIRRIYDIYQYDFFLFGYEIPQFAKDALAKRGKMKD